MKRHISSVRSRAVPLFLLAAICSAPACRRPLDAGDFTPVTSSFDNNDEGWTVLGDALPPVWRSEGGNPGGYVAARDRAIGEGWFWIAPAKYRGDMSGAYRRWLMFDLRQDRLTQNYANDDVVLVGGGITLRYDLPTDPSTAWTAFRVALEENGWVNADTGAPATRQEMQAVLRSLTELRIRGEFFRGTDEGDLDNVAFGAPR